MTICAVRDCKDRGTHKFPRDERMKHVWIKACRLTDYPITVHSRICNKHFTTDDFIINNYQQNARIRNKYVRKTAVPSIFSWTTKINYSKKDDSSEERLLFERQRRKMLLHDQLNATESAQLLSTFDNSDYSCLRQTAKDINQIPQQVEDKINDHVQQRKPDALDAENKMKVCFAQMSTLIVSLSDALLAYRKSPLFIADLEK